MTHPVKRSALLSAMALLMAGCSLTPPYQAPAVAVPSSWKNAQGETAISVPREWWTSFDSAELDTLMQRARADNPGLRAGLHRIEQSRAALKIAGASMLPTLGASGGASRSRTDPPNAGADYRTTLTAGLAVGYELDLFGASRAGIEASRANLEGTQYAQEALVLTTLGDVAQGYMTVLNNRERLRLSRETLDNAREILRLVEARHSAGSISALEVSQQRSALASAEANHAALIQQEDSALNALAVLLGQAPQGFDVAAASLTSLSVPAIGTGQPSLLLERRPDIRAAEAALRAANANIGAARAAFFPNITLGVNSSWSATSFGDPLTSAIALASSLSAPIFQGGRLEGGLEQATARQKELAETYRQTVLAAFREVEDALMAVDTAAVRENRLQTAMSEARRAYRLSQQLYDAGSTDFQALLNAQSSYFSAQDNYAQSRLARLSAAIDLYRALGGGWLAS